MSSPNQSFNIRRATTADVPALAELAALTFPDACPPHMPPQAIEDFIESQLSERAFDEYVTGSKYLVHVAEDQGVLMGYTLADLDTAEVPEHAARPSAYFSKIYSHPATRGTGLARALVEHAIDEAKAQGFASGFLGTNQANDRANAFYAKLGFEKVGTREFRVSENFVGHDYVRVKNFLPSDCLNFEMFRY